MKVILVLKKSLGIESPPSNQVAHTALNRDRLIQFSQSLKHAGENIAVQDFSVTHKEPVKN